MFLFLCSDQNEKVLLCLIYRRKDRSETKAFYTWINMLIHTFHTDIHTHTHSSQMEMWEAWFKLPPAITNTPRFLWSSWFPLTKLCMSTCSLSCVMSPSITWKMQEDRSCLFCLGQRRVNQFFPQYLLSEVCVWVCACMSKGLVTSSVNCYG